MRAGWLTLIALVAAMLVAGCSLSDESDQATISTGQAAAPPLLLRLSGDTNCETTAAIPGSDLVFSRNDDDELQWESRIVWEGVSETPVEWAVSGGTSPYLLTIDGESSDPQQSYLVPTGIASVSCAHEFTEWEGYRAHQRWYRKYLTQPVVDSGWKTIEATVTDSNGATASAALDIYVIRIVRGSGQVLTAGETYQIYGRLITIPEDQDAVMGSYGLEDEGYFSIGFIGPGYRAYTEIGVETGREGWRRIYYEDTSEYLAGAAASSDEGNVDESGDVLLISEFEINRRLDDLLESLDQPPRPRRR